MLAVPAGEHYGKAKQTQLSSYRHTLRAREGSVKPKDPASQCIISIVPSHWPRCVNEEIGKTKITFLFHADKHIFILEIISAICKYKRFISKVELGTLFEKKTQQQQNFIQCSTFRNKSRIIKHPWGLEVESYYLLHSKNDYTVLENRIWVSRHGRDASGVGIREGYQDTVDQHRATYLRRVHCNKVGSLETFSNSDMFQGIIMSRKRQVTSFGSPNEGCA